MISPQTAQHTNHLITLISGLFLVAVLIAVAGFLGFNPTTETAAQNVVQQNEEAEFTFLNASSTVTDPSASPEIVFFDESQTVEEGESFELSWDTENADQVGAFDGSASWSGTLAPDGATTITDNIPADVYTYGLRAENSATGETVTETVEIIVEAPPRYDSSFSPSDQVDLDGEPGSAAALDIDVYSQNGYEGDVAASIVSVQPSISTTDGDRIDFQINSSPVFVPAGGSGSATINMETLLPIREDGQYEVTVHLEDTSGMTDPADRNMYRSFFINVDGFSPRTIEEF